MNPGALEWSLCSLAFGERQRSRQLNSQSIFLSAGQGTQGTLDLLSQTVLCCPEKLLTSDRLHLIFFLHLPRVHRWILNVSTESLDISLSNPHVLWGS